MNTPFADAEAIVLIDATIESLLRTALEQRPRFGRGSGADSELHLGGLFTAVSRAYGTAGTPSISAAPALFANELEILRIHEVRNTIQHQSIPPAKDEVRVQVDAAQRNIRSLVKALFGLDWEHISISNLFDDPIFRSLFTRSEKALREGRVEDAVYSIIACFEAARFLEQHRIWGSLISWAKGSAHEESVLKDPKHQAIVGYVSTLHDEVEVLKLRLDYKEYRAYAQIGFGVISPAWEVLAAFGRTDEEMCAHWKKALSGNFAQFKEKGALTPEVATDLTNWVTFAQRFTSDAILRWQEFWRPGWGEGDKSAAQRWSATS
ncbi:MAG: hypothetical protein KGJ23_13660 [Euryarchaeota archaeon]|nr:hypothetical protein [Euryarchaeota archaeon]MDE2045925.1 hypothetical protein [Thermoplasmata archaeon]